MTALLCVAGWSVPAAEDSGTPIAITGVLSVIQVDDFQRGNFETLYELDELQTKHKFHVRFEKPPKDHLLSGTVVKIHGHAKANEIVLAEANGTSLEVVAPSTTVTSGEQRTVVLCINLADKPLECTPATIAGTMFANPQSVNGLYQETSSGNVWFTGDVYGPFTINFSTNACSYASWASAADAAAQAAGVNLSVYTHKVYVFPQGTACGWAGLGTIGGSPSQAWIANCNFPDVFAHELGHNLGMQHSSTDPNNDGIIDNEYGDTSDIMGYAGIGWRQINAPHREQMGWTPASKILVPATGGTFNLAPLEVDAVATPYPQVLKIAKAGGGYYYFSYRKTLGYDAALATSYSDRLNIHTDAGGSAARTLFITALSDAGLFSDPTAGFTVMQLGHNADFVQVQLSFACAPAAPTTGLAPATQSAVTVTTLNYTVSLANKDTASCPSTVFYLSPLVPAGWTANVTPSSLMLGPNVSVTATLAVTPPTGAAAGDYVVGIGVTDNFSTLHNGSASATFTLNAAANPAPSAPANLKATSPQKHRIKLKWVASVDNAGVKSYAVYRDGVQVAAATGRSYRDVGVASRVTYSYFVTAQDAAGNVSPPSNTASVKAR